MLSLFRANRLQVIAGLIPEVYRIYSTGAEVYRIELDAARPLDLAAVAFGGIGLFTGLGNDQKRAE